MVAREAVVIRRAVEGLEWHFWKIDFQLRRDRGVGTDEGIVSMRGESEGQVEVYWWCWLILTSTLLKIT